MIKQILQRAGVTLAQFASDLSISRPTLDSYIAAFDNGSKISNSFYQDIFDFLFEDQQMQAEEFSRRYKYMREYYGDRAAVPMFRKHVAWYSAGQPNSSEFRIRVNSITDVNELVSEICKFWGCEVDV